MKTIAMLFGAALSAAVPLAAQFSERIDVIAVEVPIAVRDRAGRVPANLTRDDFEVFEDGVRQEVIGLSYPVANVAQPAAALGTIQPLPQLAQRWQTVVYVQESVSTTQGLRLAMKNLVGQAERLTAMGDVEIVGDYPNPHVILSPTRDAAAVGKAFEELHRRAFGHEEILQLRTFTRRADMFATGSTRRPNPVQGINSAVFAANMEAVLVRRRQDALLTWMTRYAAGAGGGPRLLMFVSDGFPMDPLSFYWTANNTSADSSDLRSMTASTHQDEIARAIAAQGWTVYSIAAGALFQAAGSIPIMDKTYASIPAGSGEPERLADNLNPMHMLDAETGGKMTTDMTRLGGDIQSFTERLTLTYRVRRRRDGKLHGLEIRSLVPGLSVESQHSVMSGTPETVASARATALAMNFGQRGELPVTCTIRPSQTSGEETFDVTVDFTPLAAARAGMRSSSLRVALAVAPDRMMPFDNVQQFDSVDLSAKPTWDVSIPVRKRGRASAAVVTEEIGTGAWGGVRCEASR
jgi:hypothetical protein